MLREPAELRVDDQGRVELPLGLLAEAGIAPGTDVVAFSESPSSRAFDQVYTPRNDSP